ncbi:transcription antitermination factor NusB [Paremcibacter congregatus]|uniref:Transcription antitermination protein NusB n=1 Tax=Paremcibacter congregatus TaxID=2043170 RepID=A0A2G4YN05_9PROT|nr:transcription antitermination factor NusB [Paremcibacter congregatus]PHZ83709.1 transcription antitermination factor NusB [Paremcibacter congregatus]QDE27411.1 transcription antitermination factor NusB [Paremcibacter congregatus]|tara:strand:- start:3695 stop:4177 length:483 start_codon:yes stop_codon:yes gene_type:complete
MTDKAPSSQKSASKKTAGTRSASRLGAVQALYQMEMNDVFARSVIEEFMDHRLGMVIEGDEYASADTAFFADLVKGVEARLEEIDAHIVSSLSENWTLERVEPVARGILRAGVYELMARPDVPTSVIINEYVDVAKAFFDDSKPGFVNGVLDKLAKIIRR